MATTNEWDTATSIPALSDNAAAPTTSSSASDASSSASDSAASNEASPVADSVATTVNAVATGQDSQWRDPNTGDFVKGTLLSLISSEYITSFESIDFVYHCLKHEQTSTLNLYELIAVWQASWSYMLVELCEDLVGNYSREEIESIKVYKLIDFLARFPEIFSIDETKMEISLAWDCLRDVSNVDSAFEAARYEAIKCVIQDILSGQEKPICEFDMKKKINWSHPYLVDVFLNQLDMRLSAVAKKCRDLKVLDKDETVEGGRLDDPHLIRIKLRDDTDSQDEFDDWSSWPGASTATEGPILPIEWPMDTTDVWADDPNEPKPSTSGTSPNEVARDMGLEPGEENWDAQATNDNSSTTTNDGS